LDRGIPFDQRRCSAWWRSTIRISWRSTCGKITAATTSLERRWLVHPIRDLASINRKGHPFVLVGAVTFSAAMNNGAQFRSQTAALLAGQTIGDKQSKLRRGAQHATAQLAPHGPLFDRYYKFTEGPENAIRPDREIVPSWNDYKAGRDPVLEWVLSADPARLGGGG